MIKPLKDFLEIVKDILVINQSYNRTKACHHLIVVVVENWL